MVRFNAKKKKKKKKKEFKDWDREWERKDEATMKKGWGKEEEKTHYREEEKTHSRNNHSSNGLLPCLGFTSCINIRRLTFPRIKFLKF